MRRSDPAPRFAGNRGPGRRDREARFDLAVVAGWTVHEVFDLARADRIPTYGQILRRSPRAVIGSWWANGGR